MPIPQNQLEEILKNSFPEAQITVLDMVGDENHYSVTIIDKIFAGKNRVEQHKIVNKALKEILGDVLHAMQLKTLAPSE